MAERPWFYFGCYERPGHFLFVPGMRTEYTHRLSRGGLDGLFCPPEKVGLYIAALSRLGGHGYSVLSFWDRTVDTRPGSNSNFLAPSLTCSPESILAGARMFFPEVYARLPPISFLEPPP